MHSAPRLLSALLLAFFAAAALAAPAKQEPLLPKGVTLPADVAVPNDTTLAIYVPPGELRSRAYLPSVNAWIEPGKAFEDARTEVAAKLFPTTVVAKPGGEGSFGLLLALHSVWGNEAGKLKLELKYRVIDSKGAKLRESSQVQTIEAAGNVGAVRALVYKTLQLVLIDVLREIRPSATKFPADGAIASVAMENFVERTKPTATGTGFFLNPAGQLLTAAHVLRNCVVVEARQQDGTTFPVTRRVQSDLLDVAVVDSGRATTGALPFRAGQKLVLGESVTNVGYPLSGVLANSPNLTRGNVSAQAGLKGSVGLFQFSAPIQPGSSGGPVVSDGGELLGITVGTLNLGAMVRAGILPQNVNFALDAKHAATFLRREGIAFVEVPARADGSMQRANEAALAAVVQLSCYE